MTKAMASKGAWSVRGQTRANTVATAMRIMRHTHARMANWCANSPRARLPVPDSRRLGPLTRPLTVPQINFPAASRSRNLTEALLESMTPRHGGASRHDRTIPKAAAISLGNESKSSAIRTRPFHWPPMRGTRQREWEPVAPSVARPWR